MVGADRDRLRRAFRLPQAGAVPAPELEAQAQARPEVRAFLQARLRQLAAAPRPKVELPAGDEVTHGTVRCWRRLQRHAFDHVHGVVRLGDAQQLDGNVLARRAKQPDLASLSLDQCLFLDTETTGLSGGAGTIVFNVGMAFVEGGEIVVEQLLMRHFEEEPALLAQVGARLAEHPVLVTYVGKTFDRHRLAARMALHRLPTDMLRDDHLDLYHVARREWRTQLPDCRLRTVEQRILGLHREDDLPGSEAPRAFLDWVRDQTGPLDRVLEHNRLDVLSVVALLAVLGR